MDYLIYSSRKTEHCNEAEIQKILGACKKNNPDSKITGILIHTEIFFLQYIEGDSKELHKLFDKLKTDKRHSDVFLLKTGKIKERHFPNWHMGCKDYDTKALNMTSKATSSDIKTIDDLLKKELYEQDDALGMLIKFYNLI